MVDVIKDGTGKNYLAKVNSDNQLEVRSQSESLQHTQSSKNKQAYQVKNIITLSSGTITPIHIKNISKTRNMVITYMRHQVIGPSGGDVLPSVNNYFSLAFGRVRTTGTGDQLNPVNLFRGSGNGAELEVYSEPTLTGTAVGIDDWYTKDDGDMNTFNKEGSVIIAPNNTFEMSYIGNQTGGSIYMRISFFMKNINGDNQ